MTPNEETGRRFCMLSEFMLGKPVFESYKSLCSKIGDETISYQEFDFWFHRFAQGKLDLSYDRSLDPKPKELSDMPIHVVENILEHLSFLERLPVRNVSRDLRHLIDRRIADVKRIYFTISSSSFCVFIDNINTRYKVSEVLSAFQTEHDSTIESPDAMKNALKHLAYYLRNPKLKLKYLSIGESGLVCRETGNPDNITQCYRKLVALLQSLKHQISTETFKYNSVSKYFFLVALKSFKPGVLEEITGVTHWYGKEVMGAIIGTEQWKQAKRFDLFGSMPAIVHGVAHFEEFIVDWKEAKPENVVRLKELLLKSKTFKKGMLTIITPAFTTRERMVEALGPCIFRYPENPLKWSYPIPDSNEFLDFHSDRPYEISIERTT